MTDTERNYGQVEKEGLAIVFAARKFFSYIWSIFGSKKGIPVYTASRPQRWCLILQRYDFNLEYHKSTNFGQADALSKLIMKFVASQEDQVISKIDVEVHSVFHETLGKLPVTSKKVIDEKKDDINSVNELSKH